MRTVFFGTPEIAVPTVAALAQHHDVAAVVCQPDRPRGRSGRPAPPAVKEWAAARGIPVHQPQRLNDGAFEHWLREQQPEVCTVAAYGRLLKQPILDIPPLGWLNMHPSLLPRYRGPSPIQAAILNGDAETGVTIMQMTLEMDAGDIVLQEQTPLGEEENAAELSERLGVLGAQLMLDAMTMLAAGHREFRPQDPAQVTHCKLIAKEDGHIDWRAPAREIHNRVRACVPWPVAYTELEGQPLRIYRSAVVEQPAPAAPGTVTAAGKESVQVATGDLQVLLLEVQAPGKRVMTMAEFLRGRPIQVGQQFWA